MGADVLHFNLHKTLSTPHGGGGPGAGAVAVSQPLVDYLPVPWIVKTRRNDPTGLGSPEVDRQRALVLRQLPRRREGLRLPAPAGGRRTACGQRQRGLERKLSPGAPEEDVPTTVRSLVQTRVRAVRRGSAESHLDARHRQAADRLRRPSADSLLPAHRPRGTDDRADGDGGTRVPGSVRRDPRSDCGGSARAPRASARCSDSGSGSPAGPNAGGTEPDPDVPVRRVRS